MESDYEPTEVSPPGATLADLLEERGISLEDLAERMACRLEWLSELVEGKAPVTDAVALQLERVLGVPAVFWLERERRYREGEG